MLTEHGDDQDVEYGTPLMNPLGHIKSVFSESDPDTPSQSQILQKLTEPL